MKNLEKISEKIGLSLSVLCAIHCISLPFLITVLPLTGLHFLVSHEFEFIMIGASVLIATFVLYKDSKRTHKKMTPLFLAWGGFAVMVIGHLFHDISFVFSLLGGIIIIVAYVVNWRLVKQIERCSCEVEEITTPG